jgi:hypothetical protein
MYPEASIKLHSPKSMAEIANKVSSKFDERFTQIRGAMKRGALLDHLFIGSQKTSDERRCNPKNAKWLTEKDP